MVLMLVVRSFVLPMKKNERTRERWSLNVFIWGPWVLIGFMRRGIGIYRTFIPRSEATWGSPVV